MKKTSLAGLVALASLTACANSTATAPAPTSTSTSTSAVVTSPSATATTPPASSADLVIGFGSLGPAEVHMTVRQALATGMFQKVPPPPEGCAPRALEFKAAYAGVWVETDKAGVIETLRVGGEISSPGPRTEKGIGVGSTVTELKAAYGAGLERGAKSFYGDTYVVFMGHGAINFLIGEARTGGPGTKVTHIASTGGLLYDFNQDGC